MYDIEALYQADSVEAAIRLLTQHPGARLIAGGSDLLIKIREGKLAGCTLVSIHGLDALRGVKMDPDGVLRIGALTSFSHVEKDPLVRRYVPVLAGAVGQVGGPQIRNIGTIGGNVCNGVTSADSASTLMALEAALEIQGPEGKRLSPIHRHYLGPGKVDLRPDEVLTAILIPPDSYQGVYGHYIKYSMRKAMDIATLGCCALVRLDEEKTHIRRARLAFGVAGPVPMRCTGAEDALSGAPLTGAALEAAAQAALTQVTPRTSWRASREFRLQLVRELTRRAFEKAIAFAGGKIDG